MDGWTYSGRCYCRAWRKKKNGWYRLPFVSWPSARDTQVSEVSTGTESKLHLWWCSPSLLDLLLSSPPILVPSTSLASSLPFSAYFLYTVLSLLPLLPVTENHSRRWDYFKFSHVSQAEAILEREGRAHLFSETRSCVLQTGKLYHVDEDDLGFNFPASASWLLGNIAVYYQAWLQMVFFNAHSLIKIMDYPLNRAFLSIESMQPLVVLMLLINTTYTVFTYCLLAEKNVSVWGKAENRILKGNEGIFILKPNVCTHGLWIYIQVTPNSMFQCSRNFMRVL